MKLSVSMWSLDRVIQENGWSQLAFLDWAKKAGFEYVELVSYYMNNENNLIEVVKKLQELNLRVSCYTILNDFSTGTDEAWNYYLKDLEAAVKLKAPFVRVLTGGEDAGNAAEKAIILEGFKKAAIEGEKHNIIMVLENVGVHSTHSNDVYEIVSAVDSPQFRVNFDTANALLADEKPIDALIKLQPLTAYVHFKDFITDSSDNYSAVISRDAGREQVSFNGKKMTGITAGEGEVPLTEMISLLKKSGYEGFISQEYEGTGKSGEDTIKSLEYLKSIL